MYTSEKETVMRWNSDMFSTGISWGQGYAQESCAALICRAFSQGVHRIYAECDPCNTASWKLLERLGFAREAHLRQNVFFWKDENSNPIWKDTYVYGILKE